MKELTYNQVRIIEILAGIFLLLVAIMLFKNNGRS